MAKTRHFGKITVFTAFDENHGFRDFRVSVIIYWSPYLKGDINQLEKKKKVQKRATKLVYEYQKVSYEERLRRLGLTTLQQRRLRGDVIETYKIITGKENVDPTFFFTLHSGNYNTRGHPYKLEIKTSRLELRRNFYSQRVVHSFIIGIP